MHINYHKFSNFLYIYISNSVKIQSHALLFTVICVYVQSFKENNRLLFIFIIIQILMFGGYNMSQDSDIILPK